MTESFSRTDRPDAVKFACSICGTEMMAETANGPPGIPTCAFGHEPAEMEQVYLGTDAYQKD